MNRCSLDSCRLEASAKGIAVWIHAAWKLQQRLCALVFKLSRAPTNHTSLQDMHGLLVLGRLHPFAM